MAFISFAYSRKHAFVTQKQSFPLTFYGKANSCSVIDICGAIVAVIPHLKSEIILSDIKIVGNIYCFVNFIVRIIGILTEGDKLAINIQTKVRIGRNIDKNLAHFRGIFEFCKEISVFVRSGRGIFPYPVCLCENVHTFTSKRSGMLRNKFSLVILENVGELYFYT